jgi:hypothetical protein
MPKYIQIRAIERLKEQLEHGGGIASAEPPIISAQADYLVALSGGLALDEIRIRRILPLAVFISDETETASFQTLAETIINDLVPALDAEFISAPLAEVGSIGWRPTIRTNERYTAKELANREETIARACESMLATDALLHEGDERLRRAEHQLRIARISGTSKEFQDAKEEHKEATSAFELHKAQYEMEKAKHEMGKAKYEKETAMIEAFSKLAQALLKTAASCVVIVGSLHIFSHKAHPHDPGNKIHVTRKSTSEAYDSWSGEISEVLKKLAEELDSKKDE